MGTAAPLGATEQELSNSTVTTRTVVRSRLGVGRTGHSLPAAGR